MRTIQIREYKEPFELHVADAAPPTLTGPRAVRIAVKAAGLNFADTLLATGKYQEKPPLPFTPGLECAGTVLETGAEVTTVKPGDRVMASFENGGAFAEEAVAEETNVLPLPDGMAFEEAAGFPVVYGTSHLGLRHRAHLKKGETLLVLGAAGGVGLTAVEIGHIVGARVIAAAGGPEKCALAKSHGADEVIDYTREDLRERLKAFTGGRGVDVVYDPVGGDSFDAALRSLAWEGRLVVVGFAAGRIPSAPANLLLVKNCTVMGVYWGPYRKRDPETLRRAFAELLDWAGCGLIKPHVSLRFPLARAKDAFDALLARKSTGKIVLTMD